MLVDERTFIVSPLLPVGGVLPSGVKLDVSVVGSGPNSGQAVVVVVVVVVVTGVQVHSFGWPGGTHMPGHARSPLGAVTSHCSPWSSLPLPHGKRMMPASVRSLSATRWPMTTALPPIRSFANGANNRALNIEPLPMRTMGPITLISTRAGLPTGKRVESEPTRREPATSIVAGAFTTMSPMWGAASEQN